MPVTTESERKYLLKQFDSDRVPEFTELFISQYYVGDIRYRATTELTGDYATEQTRYYRTAKTQIAPGVNSEDESEITQEVFSDNYPRGDRFIRKYRYVVPAADGLKWEVDFFSNIGIIMAEIELPDIDHALELPHWISDVLIMEVTGLKQFSNSKLSVSKALNDQLYRSGVRE